MNHREQTRTELRKEAERGNEERRTKERVKLAYSGSPQATEREGNENKRKKERTNARDVYTHPNIEPESF